MPNNILNKKSEFAGSKEGGRLFSLRHNNRKEYTKEFL